ncbi:hypothetical protein F2P81_003848 [Scophthalmus maximus]|uniref:Uncharacterized protein n=1 Tax=Scophthalmus maximus TaxID=52904 RepID=A0A6A4TM37_SCOMX|nr:hypothetical protein F2P81_003848 [Scophthalmus maximus]
MCDLSVPLIYLEQCIFMYMTKPHQKRKLQILTQLLLTVSSTTVTETNDLGFATATVMLEILGYEIEKAPCREFPPRRRRLEAKIKKACSDVRQLTEVQ